MSTEWALIDDCHALRQHWRVGTACTGRKLGVNAFSFAVSSLFILASIRVSHVNLAA